MVENAPKNDKGMFFPCCDARPFFFICGRTKKKGQILLSALNICSSQS
jgi:hypothetical protein